MQRYFTPLEQHLQRGDGVATEALAHPTKGSELAVPREGHNLGQDSSLLQSVFQEKD